MRLIAAINFEFFVSYNLYLKHFVTLKRCAKVVFFWLSEFVLKNSLPLFRYKMMFNF